MNKRVIKFRIWDKRNNKFWFSGTIPDFINFICPFYSRMSGLEEMIFDWGEFTFQQFTGLSDKNNKEIYGGDILEGHWHRGHFREHKSKEKYNFVVKWSSDGNGGGFCLNHTKWCSNQKFRTFPIFQQTCVVGNIFENPELLNNKYLLRKFISKFL